MDLFSQSSEAVKSQPLAERLRPQILSEFIGQTDFSDPARPLIKNLRATNHLPNLILWGPPGTGKTSFARLISKEIKAHFISCNAIDTGAKDLREMGLSAYNRRIQLQEKTLLFIDEIHRLNKSQQDVLLPFTEKGDIILIGATTENPSYELNSALLSRSQVLVFEHLSTDNLKAILQRAASLYQIELDKIFAESSLEMFVTSVSGDARQMLNFFESIIPLYLNKNDDVSFPQTFPTVFPLTLEGLQKIRLAGSFRYDKSGDEHYDTISAFIKSVRGSHPDAAIYYLARMLEGGEDPVFIARRLVILSSEDIGNADPKALPLAIAGLQAVELIGMPEARINLAQVTTYLASAPKSNRAYLAINKAIEFVKRTGALPVPLSLRSAQTKLVQNLGYGKDYKYSHDYDRGFAEQVFLPDEAKSEKFYEPSERGFEKNISQYMAWLKKENKEN